MALDKDKRNLLQKFVSSSRKLLTTEYGRLLEGLYGLSESTGRIESIDRLIFVDDQEYEVAKILRAKASVYTEPTLAKSSEVVNRINRELAFTTLNRFVAIKIFEKRGVVLESISNGYNSKGFQLYKRVCDTSLGETYYAYRTYLLSLFDEVSDDLNSVFDRYNHFGALFPREAILIDLLNLINEESLDSIWDDEEALGWMYQYFNLDSERKLMREQSANPRDSRELAVRNQFFTPRYVVESLVDNTIGKYWVEANKGNSALKNFCRYLLLSDESTLPAVKDPRDLKILDPACGSMHFGLYAFDVLEQIYQEAWFLEEKYGESYFIRSSDLKPLHLAYSSREEFLSYIPKLIIEYNLHGVDIDPRAVQIAQMALWLKAQKSWQNNAINYLDRPKILKSNIVTAESIYITENIRKHIKATFGDSYSLFLENLEQDLALAPMLGSLIFFDRLITHDNLMMKIKSLEIDVLDLEKPDSVSFLEFFNFKDSVSKALKFTLVLINEYDAVLMNPPFGEAAKPTLAYLNSHYTEWNKNILCCFFEKAYSILSKNGSVGAIFDRTALIKSTYEEFRRKHLIPNNRIGLLIDLGWEVLDANVEVTSIVLSKKSQEGFFIDLRSFTEKSASLLDLVGSNDPRIVKEESVNFVNFPNAVIGYDFPSFARKAFATFDSLSSHGFISYTGNQLKSDRHFRNWWEVLGEDICFSSALFNGCSFEPFFTTSIASVVSPVHPFNLPIDSSTVIRNRNLHWKSAVAFGKRGEYFTAQLVEKSSMFTVEGQAFLIDDEKQRLKILCFLNTPLVRFLLNRYCGQHKYSGYVNMLPYKDFSSFDTISTKLNRLKDLKIHIEKEDFLAKEFCPSFSSFNTFEDYVNNFDEMILEYLDIIKLIEEECESQLEEAFFLNDEEILMLKNFKNAQPGLRSPVACHTLGDTKRYACLSILHYLVSLAFDFYDSDILNNYDKEKNLNKFIKGKIDSVFNAEDNLENVFEIVFGTRNIDELLNRQKNFFSFHLKSFTKNRRMSPIYWPLILGDGDYVFWLNYRKLNKDTLLSLVNDNLLPLETVIKTQIESLKRTNSPYIGEQEKLAEVQFLKNEIIDLTKNWLVGPLDGPLVIASVLRNCFQDGEWKNALFKTWEELESGLLDWTSVAYSRFYNRVREKSQNDDVIKVFQSINMREE